MAVDQHPSRRPSPPRKPPATSTTDGQPNTVAKTMQGWGEIEYGSRNGKDVRIVATGGGEMDHHFRDWTNRGTVKRAPSPGGEAADEPPGRHVGKAGRPGDEKSNDEPG